MTAQRSMTDERLAARWDKEPWVSNTGAHFAADDRAHKPAPERYERHYAPRPECIPSRAVFQRYVNDPSTSEQELHARSGLAVTVLDKVDNPDESEVGRMFRVRFADGFQAEAFEDELTFSRPPVNPVLAAFRGDNGAYPVSDWIDGIDEPDGSLAWGLNAISEQIEFARKVLTRLAALA